MKILKNKKRLIQWFILPVQIILLTYAKMAIRYLRLMYDDERWSLGTMNGEM